MGVKFAGARSVDDRRRRRIVSETEQGVPGKGPKSPSAGYLKLRRVEPDAKEPARAPIASLIPQRSWQIWLYCFTIPVLAVLLHSACSLLSASQKAAVFEILDLQSGHVWRFLRGTTLLGCAGLCWLISWFRSASVRDFEGCFKSWYWSGWILALLGMIAGTDAHLVAGMALRDGMQLNIANFVTLAWMIPLLSLLVEPVRCFTREMWHCRRSWVVFWGCSGSGLLYCWARLDGPHTDGLISETTLNATASAASVLTPMLLLSALLSQVHYVMYVSSDPVPRRNSHVIHGIRMSIHGMWTLIGRLGIGVAGLFGSLRTSWRTGSGERAEKKTARREQQAKLREEKKAAAEARRAEKQAAKDSALEKLAAGKAERLAAKNAAKEQQAAAKAEKEAARQKAAAEKAAKKEADRVAAEEKLAAAKAAKEAAAAEKAKAAEEAKAARKTRTRRKPAQPKTATPAVVEDAVNDDVPASKPAAAAGSAIAEASPETKAKPRIRVKSQSASKQKVETPANDSAPVEPAAPIERAAETSPQTASVSFEEAAAAVANSMEDGGNDVIDPALLKGLSKKEKRKLRKLHREQSRKKAG